MNRQVQVVEANISNLGMRCDPRSIEGEANKLILEKERHFATSFPDAALAGQLALLHNCVSTCRRVLRRNESILVAAKILVISRILHRDLYSSFSSTQDPPPIVQGLHKQLAPLRQIVLKRIDKRLATSRSASSYSETIDHLTEAITAYCLLTSSPSKDALDHFQQVRLEAMMLRLQEAANTDSMPEMDRKVVQALSIQTQTLQHASALLSGPLTNALGRLAIVPLLGDDSLRQIDSLSIDTFKRWVTDDLRNFTPWVKNDRYGKPEIREIVTRWSVQSMDRFTKGLGDVLASSADLSILLSLRKLVLESWFAAQSSTPTHSVPAIFKALRSIILEKTSEFLRSQGEPLRHFGQEMSTLVENCSSETGKAKPLWTPDIVFGESSHGATDFKQNVRNRYLGKSGSMLPLLDKYHAFLGVVARHRQLIEDMRGYRWESSLQDLVILDSDGDDAEASFIEGAVAALKVDDPNTLYEQHEDVLKNAFGKLECNMQDLLNTFHDPHDCGLKASILLRIIREIRMNAAAKIPPSAFSPYSFAESHLPAIEEALVSTVIHYLSSLPQIVLSKPLLRRVKISKKGKPLVSRCPGRTLWKAISTTDETELPSQSLPDILKLLRSTVDVMASLGPDIWNEGVTNAMKRQLEQHIGRFIEDDLQRLREHQIDHLEAERSTYRDGKGNEEGDNRMDMPEEAFKEKPRENEAKDAQQSNDNNDSPPASIAHPADDAPRPETPLNTKPPTQTDDVLRDMKWQLLFNICYLERALRTGKRAEEETSTLSNIQTTLLVDLVPSEGPDTGTDADDSVAMVRRQRKQIMQDRASEYWSQTHMLFGLLGR